MAKIAFIGDSHLGYRHRFKTQRLRDYVRSFEEAVEKALALDPDVTVFTGDLVHHIKPDPVSLRAVLRNLIDVAGCCPVVVLVGNHEIEGHLGTTYSPIYSDVHEDIHVLTSDSPHVLLKAGRETYGFHGFEFMRNRQRAEETLRNVSTNLEGDVNILCLHQAIEKYLSPFELSLSCLREVASNYDLIVSGHVHRNQPIKELMEVTPAYYCGSTERISFNEAENKNGFLFFDGDFKKPSYVEVGSQPMVHVRDEFRGKPEELNRKLEEVINSNQVPLLKVDYTVDLDGDLMDVRRDWSTFEHGRTILEVNVIPKSIEQEIHFEKTELNADLIREYFKATGNKDSQLEDLCVELFTRHGS